MLWLIWLVSIFGAAGALSGHNMAGTGFLLGLFLGPIGFVIALVIRLDKDRQERRARHAGTLAATQGSMREERECPFCAESILVKAKICKHCGHDVPTAR